MNLRRRHIRIGASGVEWGWYSLVAAGGWSLWEWRVRGVWRGGYRGVLWRGPMLVRHADGRELRI